MDIIIGSDYHLTVKNPEAVPQQEIPVLFYNRFYLVVSKLLREKANRCIRYDAKHEGDALRFTCWIVDDTTGEIRILAHELSDKNKKQLLSLSKDFPMMLPYEQEIAGKFGIDFLYLPHTKTANNQK